LATTATWPSSSPRTRVETKTGLFPFREKILRYFTILPVSCVRFLIHFRFRENCRYFRNFS
jgi:hypothetical protein